MNLKWKSILSKEVFYMFLIFPYVRIEGLMYITVIDAFYDILKLSVFVILIFDFILQKAIKIDKFMVTLFAWIVLSAIVVIFNEGGFFAFLVSYSPYISVILIANRAKKRGEEVPFLNGLAKLFSAFIIVNALQIIFLPNGMWSDVNTVKSSGDYILQTSVHFLGKANALSPVILGMLSFVFFRDYYLDKKYRKSSIVVALFSGISILLSRSSTGIIGLAVMALLYIIYNSSKYLKNKNARNHYVLFFAVSLCANIGVIFFDIQYSFSSIIELLFNKTATLSNRTNVWNMTLSYIENNFNKLNYLLGTGYIDYSEVIYAKRYAHCHNQFLDVFIKSGFVGVILYLMLFTFSLKKISLRSGGDKKMVTNLLGAYIIGASVMFITEVYQTPMIVLLAYMGYLFL